jgi:hypothetical protein
MFYLNCSEIDESRSSFETNGGRNIFDVPALSPDQSGTIRALARAFIAAVSKTVKLEYSDA